MERSRLTFGSAAASPAHATTSVLARRIPPTSHPFIPARRATLDPPLRASGSSTFWMPQHVKWGLVRRGTVQVGVPVGRRVTRAPNNRRAGAAVPADRTPAYPCKESYARSVFACLRIEHVQTVPARGVGPGAKWGDPGRILGPPPRHLRTQQAPCWHGSPHRPHARVSLQGELRSIRLCVPPDRAHVRCLST